MQNEITQANTHTHTLEPNQENQIFVHFFIWRSSMFGNRFWIWINQLLLDKFFPSTQPTVENG